MSYIRRVIAAWGRLYDKEFSVGLIGSLLWSVGVTVDSLLCSVFHLLGGLGH